MNVLIRYLAAGLMLTALPLGARAKEPAVCPLALFPFAERGKETKDLGPKVSDLLFAELAKDDELFLVDREEIKKVLDELELSQSGLIEPAKAIHTGQLTGAKVLVTGSAIQVDTSLYLIAKVIGTQTGRVMGASAKGTTRDELGGLVAELAKQVSAAIRKHAVELIAKPIKRDDRLNTLKETMADEKRPSVWVQISERHIGQVSSDPAAETEVLFYCRELGFKVIDRQLGDKSSAEVLIIGEAASEFAGRHGNLVSVKARLELKAVDQKTGLVIAVDRHTAIAVDLTEQIAGKSALQEAAAELATRVLPKLVESEKAKENARTRSKNRE